MTAQTAYQFDWVTIEEPKEVTEDLSHLYQADTTEEVEEIFVEVEFEELMEEVVVTMETVKEIQEVEPEIIVLAPVFLPDEFTHFTLEKKQATTIIPLSPEARSNVKRLYAMLEHPAPPLQRLA